MWSSSVLLPALLCVVHLVSGIPNATPDILKPLPVWDDDALWNTKRSIDYSHLDLRNQETFLWGNPGDGPDFTFANMTMYTKDGEMIISMERFAPFLNFAECGERMVLAFKDEASFQYAIKTWNWVNDDETHSFIMIANFVGCGPDEERQPYYIYNVDYDETRHIAYMYGLEQPWSIVAHTFELDYGKATIVQQQRRSTDLVRRFGPTLSYDKDVTMNMAHNWNRNLIDLTTPGGIKLKVDCTDCGTHGQLLFSGHIKVDLTSIKEFAISASPKDFGADLGLSVEASGTSNLAFSWQKNLGEIALAGFDIPKVASLGAVLNYNAGVTLTNWTGKATVSYGVSASLSNSAIFKVDLLDPDNKFEFSGWAPSFSQMPLKVEAQISADLEIYSQPEVSLQLSILGKGYQAAIQLKVPELEITATETHNIKGVCDDKNSKEGVEIEGKIGVELSLHLGQIGSKIGWNKPLWEDEKPFFDKCLAIDGGSAAVTTAPPSGPTPAPAAGGNGANAQTTTTVSGTHVYIPKASTTISIPALSATPTLIYNCAYMPLICANVAQYARAHLGSSTLPSKQLFFFDGNEARKDQRRKEACGCFDHSKCTSASVTNLASQIAGPHTFSPTYASLLSKGPVPTSSASGPIDPRFWSDGIALTCDEFPAASWVQGGAGASTMCATQQWSIFGTWTPKPQSGKWMLPPGSGKRSEQDWQGLSHARLRSLLAAQVGGLGTSAIAPFYFTTTSVASTPSKAWIEVAGGVKAVITKRSGDVDFPEATLSPEWAGPGRKIKGRGFITVDVEPVPDWDNKDKRSPAPGIEPRTSRRDTLHPLDPSYWSGSAQEEKRDAFPELETAPLRKEKRMIPKGDDGLEPLGSLLPPSSSSTSATPKPTTSSTTAAGKIATTTPKPTTTISASSKAKSTTTSTSADEKAKEEDEVANKGAAICGDGSEDPDYGDEGFE